MARWQWIAIAIVAIFPAGCAPVRHSLECPPLRSAEANVGDKLDIEIFVDGTPSMEGFVTTTTDNSYIRMLQAIDSVLATSPPHPNPAIAYYRLGNFTRETEAESETAFFDKIDRDNYLKAQQPEFYRGGAGQFPALEVAQIETAMESEKEGDRLAIIITDLYQKDADITNISRTIKEHHFDTSDKDYAIGILGIRSEFDGFVYDVGIDNTSFAWSGQHPFYVIFLGSYADVADTMAKLFEEVPNLQEEGRSVVFSPHRLVTDPAYLTETPLPDGLDRPVVLDNRRAIVEAESEAIELLEIADRAAEETFAIDYTVPISVARFVPEIERIEVKKTIEQFDEFDRDFKPVEGSSTIGNALELTSWQLGSNAIEFTTNLNASQLEPGMYYFIIDAIATDLEEPSWWEEWSSEEDSQDGTKTHNLAKFLRQLKNMTLDAEPAIGRFCYAVQKN